MEKETKVIVEITWSKKKLQATIKNYLIVKQKNAKNIMLSYPSRTSADRAEAYPSLL